MKKKISKKKIEFLSLILTILAAIVTIFISIIGLFDGETKKNDNDTSSSESDNTQFINNIDNSHSQVTYNNFYNYTTEDFTNKEEDTEESEKQKEKINITDIIISEQGYVDYLEQIVDDEIVYDYYADFDGDFDYELFAIVGKKTNCSSKEDVDCFCGRMWYVDNSGAMEIDNRNTEYAIEPVTFSVEGKCFIAFEQLFTTGTITYIWGVEDGSPYQPNISGRGNGLSVHGYNNIKLCCSTYDAAYEDTMFMGHTWKNYYFYYDGNTFKEYGGIKISVDDLLRIDGAKKVVDRIIAEGYQIDSVIYRDNGIININQSKMEQDATTYRYTTLRYSGLQIEFDYTNFGEQDGRGVYECALMPEIAVYPDKFPY